MESGPLSAPTIPLSPTGTQDATPPSQSNAWTEGCADPPNCNECLTDLGFYQKCSDDPDGSGQTLCHCEWRSGCAGNNPYDECATLECGANESLYCNTDVDRNAFPNGRCYCQTAQAFCTINECDVIAPTCTSGQQAVCVPGHDGGPPYQ